MKIEKLKSKSSIVKLSICALLICFVLCNTIVFAQDGASLGDIQKIVREEVKKSTDEVKKHQDDVLISIQEKTTSFANIVMNDFVKIVEDAEKKIILVATISIAGILLLIEGLFGFIRIRKEAGLLMLMKRDIDTMKKELEQNREVLNQFLVAIKQELEQNRVINKVVESDKLSSTIKHEEEKLEVPVYNVNKKMLKGEKLLEKLKQEEMKIKQKYGVK